VKIRFLLHNAFEAGGGVLTVTLALAEELAGRHDVEIISVFGRPPAVHRHPPLVKVSTVATSRGALLAARLPRNRRLAEQPSELVPPKESRYEHYSVWTDRLLARRLAKLHGGALVTMQPGLSVSAARLAPDCVLVAQEHRPFDRRPLRIRKALRRHGDNMSAFLTLTRADARQYRAWFRGRTRVPVRAMPNGVPPYAGPVTDHERPLVVAAGRLARSKGFDLLVDAWADVVSAHPEWRLDIWGDGGGRAELERQIRDAGLERSIRLRGFSRQLQLELSRASVFVLSSRAEGYPRVIQEAMACGLPVISTDCPSGPREMIEPGVDGVLVPNEDSAALGAAIVDLIEGGVERRRTMGDAAQARIRDMGQDVIASRWERLLARLERERLDGARRQQ
jgi:glycosyltransferase involved in cell wall biosynthesis